ncbi:hypothetical protein EHW67_11785 [Arenibacter aquaticus]|uniref:Alpha/beta hydrolase n=1 Tax=Arenibacter aquaticus TaxID=2489054 RepID=A0A430K3G7_9FLAO|nr:hypothetical protein [Arenibacter aquaticus]RTE53672.1 hypothetical protein EHW67_11785 [Arenibacter aquaticus]
MANRLVIISDMWGAKKGQWITSYLGYLQQYYKITFYDCQQLADLNLTVESPENLQKAFMEEGVDTAVAHLLKKEHKRSHYLAFGIGGTIAWKAAQKGLPVKSLYAISSAGLRGEDQRPKKVDIKLLYGSNDEFKPSENWSHEIGVEMETVKNFGHSLYTDEKIIGKVSLELLGKIMKKKSVA